MSKRRKWLVLLACGIFALVVLWQLLGDREPSYQGRTLSQWVDRLQQSTYNNAEAQGAIRAIGTNAIPTLLKWISYEPSPWRAKIASLIGRLSPELSRRFISYPAEQADRVVIVFRILGPEARAAIPELTRLARTSFHFVRAHRCIKALTYLGPEALPSVLTLVTNSPEFTRSLAIAALPDFGTNAAVAIPVFLPMLTDPVSRVRVTATNALFLINRKWLTNAPPE